MGEQELNACIVSVRGSQHKGVAASGVAARDPTAERGREEGMHYICVSRRGGEHERGLVEGVE